MSRPKGMPPDVRPPQKVLDWLVKMAPSACSPPVIARAAKLDELAARLELMLLSDGRFVVREGECYRAAGEDDPV